MRKPPLQWAVAAMVAAMIAAGCSSNPEPASAPVPPQQPAPPTATSPNPETGFTQIVSGSEDSVAAIPGSPRAQYAYRFKQTDPGSDRFTFQDRDLSFYFRPTPTALHFQVENRQNRTVWLEWDRSTWAGPNGSDKLAHATTKWVDRYGTQAPTQLIGLQRYSDYMFPIGNLVDPGRSDQQFHRVMFPEDQRAVQYIDNVFGVDLWFRIEDRLVPYRFRFKVANVVPR